MCFGLEQLNGFISRKMRLSLPEKTEAFRVIGPWIHTERHLSFDTMEKALMYCKTSKPFSDEMKRPSSCPGELPRLLTMNIQRKFSNHWSFFLKTQETSSISTYPFDVEDDRKAARGALIAANEKEKHLTQYPFNSKCILFQNACRIYSSRSVLQYTRVTIFNHRKVTQIFSWSKKTSDGAFEHCE